MKKFTVRVYEVHSFDVNVEADDEGGALEAANEYIQENEIDPTYDYTFETDKWVVNLSK